MSLGIDFGASWCRAFYSIGDKSWPVYSKDGYALIPSAVEYKIDLSVLVVRLGMIISVERNRLCFWPSI